MRAIGNGAARIWDGLTSLFHKGFGYAVFTYSRFSLLHSRLQRRQCQRLAGALIGLIALNPIAGWLDPRWGFWWQVIVLSLLLAVLVFVYWPFLPSLVRYVLDHGGQFLILLVLYLLVWGQIGVGLGIPALIWNENPWVRVISALGSTLLLAMLGVNAYYLGVNPRALADGTRATEHTKEFMSRFGINLPFGSLIEPEYPNGKMISMHLRLSRLPFLVLLSLPTLFPSLFYYVTSEAPIYATYGPRLSSLDWKSGVSLDTRTGVLAYLYAVGIWFAGVMAGLFVVKLLFWWISVRVMRRGGEHNATQALVNYMLTIVAVYVLFWMLHWSGVGGIPPSLAIFAFLGLLATVNIVYIRAFTQPLYGALGVAWVLCLAIYLVTLVMDTERADLAALSLLVLSAIAAQLGPQVPEAGYLGIPRRAIVRSLVLLILVLLAQLLVFRLLGTWRPGAAAWALAALVVGMASVVAQHWLEPEAHPAPMTNNDVPPAAPPAAPIAGPPQPDVVAAGAPEAAAAAPRHPRTGTRAAAAYYRRERTLVVLALIGWVLLVNHDQFKERFDLRGNQRDPYRQPTSLSRVLDDSYNYNPADRLDYTNYARLEQGIAKKEETNPTPPLAKVAPARLLNSQDVLKQWDGRIQELRTIDRERDKAEAKEPAPLPSKPKLVLVCVSGGAIRSAYWTAIVLDRLNHEFYRQIYREESPTQAKRIRLDFHDHVRVIAGASGGMVGTAYYVRWLTRRRNPQAGADQSASWYEIIPRASLNPVARYMALETPVRMLLPRLPWSPSDRGTVLQDDWSHLGRETFHGLAHNRGDDAGPEARGEVPSLIYSPMIVDDGRRLLISNLDLMTGYRPGEVGPNQAGADRVREDNWEIPLTRNNDLDDDNDATNRRPVSISALELFKIAPQSQGMSLATAARMSATFPFVSPAVALPTEPPLRVVDAGYYDNYGVTLACAWAIQNREWIANNTSGLLIVQIRDSLSTRDRRGVPEPRTGFFQNLFTGMEFFTSVKDAVLRARYTTMAFRNDQEIAMLSQIFLGEGLNKPPGFVATVIFENTARFGGSDTEAPHWPGLDTNTIQVEAQRSVAMNWYITQAELKALHRAIPTPASDLRRTPDLYATLLTEAKARLAEAEAGDPDRGGVVAPAPRLTGFDPVAARRAEAIAYRNSARNAARVVYRLQNTPDMDQEIDRHLQTLRAHPPQQELTDDQRRLLRVAHIGWLNYQAQLPDEQGGSEDRRAYFQLEFERAMNYERLVSLYRWWRQSF